MTSKRNLCNCKENILKRNTCEKKVTAVPNDDNMIPMQLYQTGREKMRNDSK